MFRVSSTSICSRSSDNKAPYRASVLCLLHQSENWITGLRRRLASRREEKPETKGGQIWALWREIKAALANGQTFKSIRLWLEEEGGVIVTPSSPRSYVRRCRRKEGGRRAADTTAPAQPIFNRPNPPKVPVLAALSPAVVSLRATPESPAHASLAHDPMAIARERSAQSWLGAQFRTGQRGHMAKLGCCFLILLVIAGTLPAQQSTAELNGLVRDVSGAAVPETDLVLRNVDTNVERHTISNSVGNYVFVDIPSGNYTVEARKTGFSAKKVEPFPLAVSQTATIDISLALVLHHPSADDE
jgi:hypothetical protein